MYNIIRNKRNVIYYKLFQRILKTKLNFRIILGTVGLSTGRRLRFQTKIPEKDG